MLRAVLVDAEGLKPSGRWVDNRQPALCRARYDPGGPFGLPFRLRGQSEADSDKCQTLKGKKGQKPSF